MNRAPAPRILAAVALAAALACSSSPTAPPAPPPAAIGAGISCDTALVAFDSWDPETGEHHGELWRRIACPDSVRWERVY